VNAQACPPSWPAEAWALFEGMMEEVWVRGEHWTTRKAKYYAPFLDGHEPDAVVAALQSLADGGQTFLPAVGEIIGAIHHDHAAPSWAEAFELIYGRDGCLRGPRRATVELAGGEQARDDAIVARAEDKHPVLGAFVAAQTPKRLRMLRIDHEEYGELERRRLGEEWAEFADRADRRRREGLPLLTPALAQRTQLGPRRMNPAALLPTGRA